MITDDAFQRQHNFIIDITSSHDLSCDHNIININNKAVLMVKSSVHISLWFKLWQLHRVKCSYIKHSSSTNFDYVFGLGLRHLIIH
jgi:hypothetical protein